MHVGGESVSLRSGHPGWVGFSLSEPRIQDPDFPNLQTTINLRQCVFPIYPLLSCLHLHISTVFFYLEGRPSDFQFFILAVRCTSRLWHRLASGVAWHLHFARLSRKAGLGTVHPIALHCPVNQADFGRIRQRTRIENERDSLQGISPD